MTVSIRGKNETAIVAFVGETKFASGTWYGLRLNRAVGRNNGSIKGVRYFQSEARRGLFVKRASITPVARVQRDHRLWRQNKESKSGRGGGTNGFHYIVGSR